MIDRLMGYTVHKAKVFRPHTILFTKENETITVSMLQEAVSHMIDAVMEKNPILRRYEVTLKVLRVVRIRLANGQPRKPSKNELKVACDVLLEIQKEHTATETQGDNIDRTALWCKLFIDCFIRDEPSEDSNRLSV